MMVAATVFCHWCGAAVPDDMRRFEHACPEGQLINELRRALYRRCNACLAWLPVTTTTPAEYEDALRFEHSAACDYPPPTLGPVA